MKQLITVLFISCIMLTGCSKDSANESYYDSLIITYQKTVCFGECPAYEMTIKGSGEVVFKGESNVDKIGTYTLNISEEEVDSLYEAFQEADFFNLQDEYTADVTDLPTTFITISYNDKSKKVVDYYGAPKLLKILEKYIETYVNKEGWEKVE